METLSPVESPPKWLGSERDCADGPPEAYLDLWNARDSVPESVAVAEYAQLSEDSKLLVRFAVERGRAQTCSRDGVTSFMTLLDDLDELALEPYREENYGHADSTAIHAAGGYYDIDRLVVDDMVLD